MTLSQLSCRWLSRRCSLLPFSSWFFPVCCSSPCFWVTMNLPRWPKDVRTSEQGASNEILVVVRDTDCKSSHLVVILLRVDWRAYDWWRASLGGRDSQVEYFPRAALISAAFLSSLLYPREHKIIFAEDFHSSYYMAISYHRLLQSFWIQILPGCLIKPKTRHIDSQSFKNRKAIASAICSGLNSCTIWKYLWWNQKLLHIIAYSKWCACVHFLATNWLILLRHAVKKSNCTNNSICYYGTHITQRVEKKRSPFVNIALHEIPPDHSCWYTRFELQLYISIHEGARDYRANQPGSGSNQYMYYM